MTTSLAAELMLTAEAEAIADAVAAVLVYCRDWALPEPALFQIELGLTEALNNIVQHACRDLTRPTVRITLHYAAPLLELTLCDPGRPMPNPPAPDLPDDELDEGGRGWFIIYACFDTVDYARHADGNRLTLRKQLLENH